MTRLKAAFLEFDRANPHVYRLLCHFADQAIAAGRNRIGSQLLFERVRWETYITTTDADFKLNNNHVAYYSRKWLKEHPEYPKFFATRRVQGENLHGISMEKIKANSSTMITEIKERLTITQLGRELFPDWVPAKSCRSPFRPDRSPSFSVYNDGKLFMDFGTGDRGDVIDFYALAKGISAPEAMLALWERLESGKGHCERPLTPPKSSAERKNTPTPDDPFALPYTPSSAEYQGMRVDCDRLLKLPEAIESVASYRHWEPEIVRDLAYEGVLGLSSAGHITFNFLSGSKSRWLDEKGKRVFRWNFGRAWFWRGDLIPQAERIWMVEGETKCVQALCWGWEKPNREKALKRVIAIPAASFDPAPWAFLFTAKEVVYVADPDPAGKAAAERIKAALVPVAASVVILYPQDLTT